MVCTANCQMKRIRSVPGNRARPVRSSAIMHPTDQISTETQKDTDIIPRTLFYLQTDHRGELLYAVYLSCCNASSSTWSLGHGTSGSPRSRSSHRRCVVPDQSPKSDNNLDAKKKKKKQDLKKYKQIIYICRQFWDKLMFQIKAALHWPSAHSLHSLQGYLVLNPVVI